MTYQNTILIIKRKILQTEKKLLLWFDEPEDVRNFRPVDSGWTIDEILEHISLTSFFLLKIIRKHVERAIKRADAGSPIIGSESDLQKLEPVGVRGSNRWVRPEHMEPRGRANMEDVKAQLHEQFAECLSLLEEMHNGSGSLATVNMSVGNLGKMDMYQWIYFLTLHAWRHHFQMKEVREEYYRKHVFLAKITEDEVEQLRIISIDTFLETYEAHNDPAEMRRHIDQRFSEDALREELNNVESQFFFAWYKAEVAGYLKLNWGTAQTEQVLEDAIEIERIYVASRYHGRGVGKILFEKSLEIAEKKNSRHLWLGVWEENPRAIRFYEKQGLEIFDTHVFVVGEDRQTDYLMKLEL